MNLIEHYVIEVLERPCAHVMDNGDIYYTVKCKVDCYGRITTEKVFVRSIKEALAIKPGYMYLG